MKASELRIGNWVDSELRNMQIELFDFADILNYYNANNLDHIKPIPLTEEWLVKFGFEKGWGNDLRKPLNNDVVLSIQFNNGIYLMVGDDFETREIKHLHQLQNLFFALTGEELTIKE